MQWEVKHRVFIACKNICIHINLTFNIYITYNIVRNIETLRFYMIFYADNLTLNNLFFPLSKRLQFLFGQLLQNLDLKEGSPSA